MDCGLPGSSTHGIFQARVLEWVAISFSNRKVKSESEVAQSCLTSSDPIDCGLPGSSTHGIFQARVLEWGAIAFSISKLVWPKPVTPKSATESLPYNSLQALRLPLCGTGTNCGFFSLCQHLGWSLRTAIA